MPSLQYQEIHQSQTSGQSIVVSVQQMVLLHVVHHHQLPPWFWKQDSISFILVKLEMKPCRQRCMPSSIITLLTLQILRIVCRSTLPTCTEYIIRQNIHKQNPRFIHSHLYMWKFYKTLQSSFNTKSKLCSCIYHLIIVRNR